MINNIFMLFHDICMIISMLNRTEQSRAKKYDIMFLFCFLFKKINKKLMLNPLNLLFLKSALVPVKQYI